jgi:hypothetical protein
MNVLIPDYDSEECTDYTLRKDARSCWITVPGVVSSISVYIVRDDKGVSVDLFYPSDASDDSIDMAHAFFYV